MNLPNNDGELTHTAVFCGKCGEEIGLAFCDHCGRVADLDSIVVNDGLCRHCHRLPGRYWEQRAKGMQAEREADIRRDEGKE